MASRPASLVSCSTPTRSFARPARPRVTAVAAAASNGAAPAADLSVTVNFDVLGAGYDFGADEAVIVGGHHLGLEISEA